MDQTQELTIIDKSIDIFKGGGAILLTHQIRASKALKVGQSILEQWDAAYVIEDEEQRRQALSAADERSNKFLANCSGSKTEMEESRKAITQLMDAIKKMFTEEENKLDTKKGEIPVKVQAKRNQYAKEELEFQERRRKEAENKAAKAKEEAELRAYIRNTIATALIDSLARKKQTVTEAFNKISLADYDLKSQGLQAMSCVFPVSKLDELLVLKLPVCPRHKDDEVSGIRDQERSSYDFNSFYTEYGRQLTELKQSLIDRLPAKKQELEEQKRIADEAETARQAELKRQEEAEKKRREDLAKSKDQAERERIEADAAAERQREADRLAAMEKEAEDKRLAAVAEQQRREKEEADRQAAEVEAARKAAEEEIEVSKAANTAAALFEQTAEASVSGPAPETRNGFDITVTHAAGWVELFQFWFQREANTLTIEEMGKKSLNQMKTYAEGVAKKEGTKIESKYLKYEASIKAVNRKEK